MNAVRLSERYHPTSGGCNERAACGGRQTDLSV